jgi:hypothetical protein
LIAIMVAIKLSPFGMVAWLIGTRRFRAVVVVGIGLAIAFVLGGLGAGFDSYLDNIRVLRSVGFSPLSVSGLTGISWASYAVFGAGIIAALALGRRSDAASYVSALVAAVLGNPALYPGHLVPLLAVVAPLTDRRAATVKPSEEPSRSVTAAADV